MASERLDRTVHCRPCQRSYTRLRWALPTRSLHYLRRSCAGEARDGRGPRLDPAEAIEWVSRAPNVSPNGKGPAETRKLMDVEDFGENFPPNEKIAKVKY